MKKARFFESIQKKDFFKPAIWANTYKHILLCHNRMQEEDSKYCIFEDEFSDIEVDEHILIQTISSLYIFYKVTLHLTLEPCQLIERFIISH